MKNKAGQEQTPEERPVSNDDAETSTSGESEFSLCVELIVWNLVIRAVRSHEAAG